MFTRIGTKIKSPAYVSHIERISDIAVIKGDTVTFKKCDRFVDPRLKADSMSVYNRMVNGTFQSGSQNTIPPTIESVYNTMNHAQSILENAQNRLAEIERYNSVFNNNGNNVTLENNPE